ncbi:MAG: hypothetical protein EPO55_22080 [Reyranella sp.]|uniref:nucleotidyltransferase domain-containing protein n=1 Tax=Reyranella sp. TaxID=1929291 RepID=UPI00121F5E7A|nr:nucleotidyltransferase family protein [Reyranella sp.]TAJ36387.1 MAG: hypothetical protein EPO55_22080 [Reyranella sp.]
MPGVRTGGAEFDLLCLATRPKPDLTRIRALLHTGIDHPSLTRLAEGHGVRPQLFQSLSDVSWEAVPETERDSLERFRQRHLVRTLTLSGELHRLATAFEGKAIPFVAFKGPALAIALYGDLARREYNDIDVLVPEHRLDDAEDVVAALGYLSGQGDRAFRRAFLAHLRQTAFARADGDAAIDLHWALSGPHVPFPLKTADVWNDLRRISIGDRDIPTIAGANLALLLAGHGTKEVWKLLKWVSDFALMIDRHRDLDWSEIHRRARAQGCGDAILLGCAMTRELLDVAVPGALAGLLAQSDRVHSRALLLAERMRAGQLPSSQGENFSDLGLCDRRLDRIKGTLRLAFTPTPGDYAALKLPPALWGAYYATRPFRLAFKTLAGTG